MYYMKKQDKPLSKLEEQVAQVVVDLENSSTEIKNDLKDFFLDHVKEVELTLHNKKTRNVLVML